MTALDVAVDLTLRPAGVDDAPALAAFADHRAIAFYARHGFAQVGSAPFLLGTDLQIDPVMVRPLSRNGAKRLEPDLRGLLR
jgi:hypothetical protein